jgi:hypothetical protein
MKLNKSKSRKCGGFSSALSNAAGASLLPVGLLLAQQYYKRKSRKNKFNNSKKSFFRSRRR